ncbi:ABC transporter permease [Simkania negevensis]|uniref:ABC transporter permease n=1 Tax=Simkania negevensis TaxID=83561 RepID=A0ABS3AQP3_9BACT|nr:ABC transporter permease [Simkania negevensis]
MFFEFAVAIKYFLPRWRQLSTSIISILSILVISLVVWLILVFLSVTYGIEKGWVDRLVTFYAPLRLTPTEEYYNSYYYQVDQASEASGYHTKTIGQKRVASLSNPYDPLTDVALPLSFPRPLSDEQGTLHDVVKETFSSIEEALQGEGGRATDYESGLSTMRLRLLRGSQGFAPSWEQTGTQTFLSQGAYVTSFDEGNSQLHAIVAPPTIDDINNLMLLLPLSSASTSEDHPSYDPLLPKQQMGWAIASLFSHLTITSLKTTEGWELPSDLLPKRGSWQGSISYSFHGRPREFIPGGKCIGGSCEAATLSWDEKGAHITTASSSFPSSLDELTIRFPADTGLPAQIIASSLPSAESLDDIAFSIDTIYQGVKLNGVLALTNLLIGEAAITHTFDTPPASSPPWLYALGNKDAHLPSNPLVGQGVLLSKSLKENGALLGDRGYLSYYAPTPSGMQEQRISFYIAGFYDHGLVPFASKNVIATHNITSLLMDTMSDKDKELGNGINVWIDHTDRVQQAKEKVIAALEEKGLAPYWKVETFEEYDFARDIVLQLKSDRVLFTLIACIIIAVACSNIISMLILLVNDKKQEIGIMRAMGASTFNIAAIFGLCGMATGLVSSAIGTICALFTLKHIDALGALLSAIQGHDAFNAAFFGDKLPDTISSSALTFVLIATLVISLGAGLIPALKACMMKPSTILRGEG